MSNLQDNFVSLIQLLLDDDSMQHWFVSLSSMSVSARAVELRNMALKMHQADEPEDVVKMIASMSDTKVFESVRAVLLAELNQKSQ